MKTLWLAGFVMFLALSARGDLLSVINGVSIGERFQAPDGTPEVPLYNGSKTISKTNPTWEDRSAQCYGLPQPMRQIDDWTNYNNLMMVRAKIAANLLNQDLQVAQPDSQGSGNLKDFITSLVTLKPMFAAVQTLSQNPTIHKVLTDPAYGAISSNPEFLTALANTDITNPQFSNLPSSLVQQLKNTQALLQNPQINNALNLLHEQGLEISPLNDQADYQALMAFYQKTIFEKGDGSLPVLMKDMPALPSALSGPFSQQVRRLIEAEVQSFVLTRQPVESDLTSSVKAQVSTILGHAESSDADILNALDTVTPPVADVAFDDIVRADFLKNEKTETVALNGKQYTITPDQKAAVAGVARTLMGEARSCQALPGVHQFEAVGSVINLRALSIQAQVNQQQVINTDDQQIINQDVDKALHNQSLEGLQHGADQGMSDFGRAGVTGMNYAEQVISRPLQFSVWNSYSQQSIPLSSLMDGSLSPSIPEVSIRLQKPLDLNDESALGGALCPKVLGTTGTPDPLWTQAFQVAESMVLDPETFYKTYTWNPVTPNIFFYTHGGVDLPFALPKKINSITYLLPTGKTESLNLRPNDRGACGLFQLFESRPTLQYGIQ